MPMTTDTFLEHRKIINCFMDVEQIEQYQLRQLGKGDLNFNYELDQASIRIKQAVESVPIRDIHSFVIMAMETYAIWAKYGYAEVIKPKGCSAARMVLPFGSDDFDTPLDAMRQIYKENMSTDKIATIFRMRLRRKVEELNRIVMVENLVDYTQPYNDDFDFTEEDLSEEDGEQVVSTETFEKKFDDRVTQFEKARRWIFTNKRWGRVFDNMEIFNPQMVELVKYKRGVKSIY